MNLPEPKIELNGWVTISTLAGQMGVTTQVISQRIALFNRTGKGIPSIVCKELNNIRLVPSLELQQSFNAE